MTGFQNEALKRLEPDDGKLSSPVPRGRGSGDTSLLPDIFANAVSVSRTNILVGELAKIIKGNGVEMGQNRLFEYLRQHGFLAKRKGSNYNTPTQKSMKLKLFKIQETAITHSDGRITISKTTKVTGKGQQYFVNLFLNSDNNYRLIDEELTANTNENEGFNYDI